MDAMYRHFARIARKFSTLRTADPLPVRFLVQKLAPRECVRAADIGCGAGRYDMVLLRRLGERLHLICVDPNEAMLRASSWRRWSTSDFGVPLPWGG